MQEHEGDRTVDRRRLLRRAGTIAVGAAGVSAAGAVLATPAQAADGDSLVLGSTGDANNRATTTTTLELTASADADRRTALRLENPAGAALSVTQTSPSLAAPAGSVFVDEVGDIATVSADAQGAYVTYAYSPTWATMVVPISPVRWLDTRYASSRAHIVPGSATLDSTGRIVPRNSTTAPDMVLDLSDLFAGGFGAVQANLTVVNPAGTGYASLWDDGAYPGTSSINYGTSLPALANFTQTLIGPNSRIRLRTSKAAHFLFDIVGFVVADPYAQLVGFGTMAGSQQLSAQDATPSVRKRRPPVR